MDEFDVKSDYKYSISKVMDISSFSGRQVANMLANYTTHPNYVDIAADEKYYKISFHKSINIK